MGGILYGFGSWEEEGFEKRSGGGLNASHLLRNIGAKSNKRNPEYRSSGE